MPPETNDTTTPNEQPTPPENQSTPVTTQPPQATPVSPQKPKTKKKGLIITLSIIGAVLLLGAGTAAGMYVTKFFESNNSLSLNSTSDGNAPVSDEERSIAAVAEKVGPSVVSIVTETQSRSFYGASAAAGTGIIVSKDGYVMTNNHVLENARSVSVIDSEGELYEEVRIIGRDPLNDIAFLKVSTNKNFTPAQLGDSSTIRSGQQVVAIGNALGQYNNTVTSGIVSGTGRPITAGSEGGTTETLTDLIQTDASINPGNSGGPLVNMAGQVIGINTAIVEDANGIGFAIPVNATKGILAGVLEDGKVTRSYLGVNYLTITPDVAREYNLSVKSGAYVFASGDANPIVANGPADKAGLKKGDIITKINGEAIGKQGGLSSILGKYRPNDKITLDLIRDGKEQTTTLTLGTYEG